MPLCHIFSYGNSSSGLDFLAEPLALAATTTLNNFHGLPLPPNCAVLLMLNQLASMQSGFICQTLPLKDPIEGWTNLSDVECGNFFVWQKQFTSTIDNEETCVSKPCKSENVFTQNSINESFVENETVRHQLSLFQTAFQSIN